MQGSHCGGFSYRGAQALGVQASVVVACRLWGMRASVVVARELSSCDSRAGSVVVARRL